jgi:beta-glucanase (GH16 family)
MDEQLSRSTRVATECQGIWQGWSSAAEQIHSTGLNALWMMGTCSSARWLGTPSCTKGLARRRSSQKGNDYEECDHPIVPRGIESPKTLRGVGETLRRATQVLSHWSTATGLESVPMRRPVPRTASAAVFLLTMAALAPISAGRQEWRMVWSDDFAGPANSRLNESDWLYDLGTQYPGGPFQWGTGEVEVMTDDTANVYQDGLGRLVIKPLHSGPSPTKGWTSGRVETQRVFDAPDGGAFAVEAAIQIPNVNGAAAAGYWPAFWMLGSAFRGNYYNGPRIGEIDIMEAVNGRESVFAALHCGTAPGGPCNEFAGISSGERSCAGCKTAFRVYRVEVDRSRSPQQIRWFLDGTEFFRIESTAVDAATWSDATQHPFFVILNVAIGGGFPDAFGGGPTGSTASGVPMLVDYVRVFRRSPEFTDDELTAGSTPIRAVHLVELRNRVNAVRRQLKLADREWSEAIIAGSTVVRAFHLMELHNALREAYLAARITPPDLDSDVTAGAIIKASHITKLRSAVTALE